MKLVYPIIIGFGFAGAVVAHYADAAPLAALNPAVTQATIGTTICVRGYAASIRPPEKYTEALKVKQMRAQHIGPLRDYEEDHLVPLSLGGSPTDPSNLWPQKRTGRYGAVAKDRVEASLHRKVCSGKISLDAAQQLMQSWRR